MGHVASGPLVPLDQVPVLFSDTEGLPAHVRPDFSSGPLHFRLVDVADPVTAKGLPLEPFFRVQAQRYQMYWQLTTKEGLAARREKEAAEERAKALREAATVDSVAVGEQQPEVEHDLKGDSQTGINEGRRWRDGLSFQYTFNAHGEKAVDLVVTYWGGDAGRTFDITANGKLLATEQLTGAQPGKFFDKRYPIPADVLTAATNGRVTIKFDAKVWVAGGVYDVRLMRPEAKEL
jgi:hypothetical protein